MISVCAASANDEGNKRGGKLARRVSGKEKESAGESENKVQSKERERERESETVCASETTEKPPRCN